MGTCETVGDAWWADGTAMQEVKEGAMRAEEYFSFRGVRYRYLRWERETAHAESCAQTKDDAHAVGDTTPLVLLHGFAQSADSWDEVAGKLASRRAVYAVDLVGHGKSDRPVDRDAYRIEAQGEMVLAFLAQVVAAPCPPKLDPVARYDTRPTRDAAPTPASAPLVVGYSMGGRLALVAACHDPLAFSGLVLESAGLGPATDAERCAAAGRDADAAACLRTEGVEAFMDGWERLPLFASQGFLPACVRSRLRAGRCANDAEALARTFEEAGQHAMPNCAEEIGSLSLPVLYLAGSKDRKYRAIAEGLKPASRMTVQVVGGAGHNIHLEAPDAFVCAVEAFLNAAT